MRRNIINKTYIEYIWVSALLIYAPISPMFIMLPPLIGITYMVFIEKYKNGFYIFIITFYLLLHDINFSLIPFSSIMIFFILRNISLESLEKATNCKKCLYLIKILSIYFGYFACMYIISFIANMPYITINYSMVLYYIAIEFLISIIIFNE